MLSRPGSLAAAAIIMLIRMDIRMEISRGTPRMRMMKLAASIPAGRSSFGGIEDGVPPRFRLRHENKLELAPVLGESGATIETERPGGARQTFRFVDRGAFLESVEEIPEPHAFKARLRLAGLDREDVFELDFVEHAHAGTSAASAAERDNNMRAAFVHVAADAGVSVLAIGGLLLGRFFGWVFMDPVMGLIGALVIANWAYGLMRDTGSVLLDMNPDKDMTDELRRAIESGGDRLADLHVWRLGPGHLGAIISVLTDAPRDAGILPVPAQPVPHALACHDRSAARDRKTMTASRSNTMISIYLVSCMILF